LGQKLTQQQRDVLEVAAGSVAPVGVDPVEYLLQVRQTKLEEGIFSLDQMIEDERVAILVWGHDHQASWFVIPDLDTEYEDFVDDSYESSRSTSPEAEKDEKPEGPESLVPEPLLSYKDFQAKKLGKKLETMKVTRPSEPKRRNSLPEVIPSRPERDDSSPLPEKAAEAQASGSNPLGINKNKVPLAKRLGFTAEQVNALRAAALLPPMESPSVFDANGKVIGRNPNFIATPHWLLEGFQLFGAPFEADVKSKVVTNHNYGLYKQQHAPHTAKKGKGPSAEARALYSSLIAEWTAYRKAHAGVPVVSNPNTDDQKAALDVYRSIKSRMPQNMRAFLPKLGKAPPKKKEKPASEAKGKGRRGRGRGRQGPNLAPAAPAPAAPATPAPSAPMGDAMAALMAVLTPFMGLMKEMAAIVRPHGQ
jgi:hypothetical protein